jgi:hypothetical protein
VYHVDALRQAGFRQLLRQDHQLMPALNNVSGGLTCCLVWVAAHHYAALDKASPGSGCIAHLNRLLLPTLHILLAADRGEGKGSLTLAATAALSAAAFATPVVVIIL